MNKKPLIAVVAVCLIIALVTPAVLAYTTNDVFYVVKDIQCKVNSLVSKANLILSKLSSIQSALNSLSWSLWSASDSVKNDTLAINQKLDDLDSDVSDVEAKLDENGRLGSTTQMSSRSGMYVEEIGIGEFYVVTARTNYYTSKYTISYHVYSNESKCWANIYAGDFPGHVMDERQIDNPVGGQYETTGNFECAAESIAITFTHGVEPCAVYMEWYITVESPAGTPPVDYDTTFP